MGEIDFYKQILQTAQSFNALCRDSVDGGEFLLIGRDTAAKILSVVYLQGGDERMVLSPKLRADLEYIQDSYGIHGCQSVDLELAMNVKYYITMLERHVKEHSDWPSWVYMLFRERYNFNLYKP